MATLRLTRAVRDTLPDLVPQLRGRYAAIARAMLAEHDIIVVAITRPGEGQAWRWPTSSGRRCVAVPHPDSLYDLHVVAHEIAHIRLGTSRPVWHMELRTDLAAWLLVQRYVPRESVATRDWAAYIDRVRGHIRHRMRRAVRSGAVLTREAWEYLTEAEIAHLREHGQLTRMTLAQYRRFQRDATAASRNPARR